MTERQFMTRRFLDESTDPPAYVDEVLPTRSIKFQGAGRVSEARSPAGTALGSLRLTGTFYETAKGTASLRITRLSLGISAPTVLGIGTPAFGIGTHYRWHIRHSREGTMDVVAFAEPGRLRDFGNGLAPLYSAGPGTLFWGWLGDHQGQLGTQVSLSQSMEGLLG